MIVFRAKKGVLSGEMCTRLNFKPTAHPHDVCYLSCMSSHMVAGSRMVYVVPAFKNVTMEEKSV